MKARILYAGVPLAAALLCAGANAQGVPQLTQDQQTTVYRTIVRESAAPQARPSVRKQSKQIRQTKQIVRMPAGNVVRTTTTERIVTRPAPLARERVIAAPPAPATFVTADPLDLTPDQRTTVYRTLVQQPVQPVVTERIVTAPRPFVTAEPVEQRVIAVPQTTGAATVVTDEPAEIAAPAPVRDLTIGARVPSSIPLYAMPASAAAAAPAIGAYRYALIGDRVYLVDPRDGVVAAMLYQ